MKKYIFIFILSLLMLLQAEDNKSINKVSNDNNTTTAKTKQLIIDLDKEKNNTRGNSKKGILKGSIFLGDNDEVHFKGKILVEKAPVTISYGDNDEVALIGGNFTINTLELKTNEHIILKDKDGKIFIDKIIRR